MTLKAIEEARNSQTSKEWNSLYASIIHLLETGMHLADGKQVPIDGHVAFNMAGLAVLADIWSRGKKDRAKVKEFRSENAGRLKEVIKSRKELSAQSFEHDKLRHEVEDMLDEAITYGEYVLPIARMKAMGKLIDYEFPEE